MTYNIFQQPTVAFIRSLCLPRQCQYGNYSQSNVGQMQQRRHHITTHGL